MEVLTFAKSSGHFTTCFGSQVHQVLYLCSKEPWTAYATSRLVDRVLFHICVRTLYAKDIFEEKLSIASFGQYGGKCVQPHEAHATASSHFIWSLGA